MSHSLWPADGEEETSIFFDKRMQCSQKLVATALQPHLGVALKDSGQEQPLK